MRSSDGPLPSCKDADRSSAKDSGLKRQLDIKPPNQSPATPIDLVICTLLLKSSLFVQLYAMAMKALQLCAIVIVGCVLRSAMAYTKVSGELSVGQPGGAK